MGIKWAGSYCNGKKLNPHYMVIVAGVIDGGYIYQCVKCHRHKWLPAHYKEAIALGNLMVKYGDTVGYQMMLDKYPKAKVMMAKLQDLDYVRKVVKDDEDFTQVVGVVMRKKEYDKEEL